MKCVKLSTLGIINRKKCVDISTVRIYSCKTTQVKTQNNPSTQIFKHSLQRDRLCVLLKSNFAAICLQKAVEFNPDTILVRNSVDYEKPQEQCVVETSLYVSRLNSFGENLKILSSFENNIKWKTYLEIGLGISIKCNDKRVFDRVI